METEPGREQQEQELFDEGGFRSLLKEYRDKHHKAGDFGLRAPSKEEREKLTGVF